MKNTMLAFLLIASGSAHGYASDVYKWTDEQGKTHYGDAVPGVAKEKAEVVEISPKPTAAARKEAEARAAKSKALLRLREKENADPTEGAVRTLLTEKVKPPQTKKDLCQEQRKAYEASYACFDPYRFGNGKIKAEAYDNCKEVTDPGNCE